MDSSYAMDNESFQFLSSLSPRIKPNRTNNYKGPTLLALKKAIRRSSYSTKSKKCYNDSISIIEIFSDSSIENEHIENPTSSLITSDESNEIPDSFEKSSGSKLVFSSDDSIIPCSNHEEEFNLRRISFQKKTNVNTKRKVYDVEKWIEESNFNRLTIQNNEAQSQLNDSDKQDENYELKELSTSDCSVNKSCIEDSISSISSKNEDVSSKEKNDAELNSQSNDVINDSDISEKSYENLLDDLYGNSWRLKKDEILPKSERKYKQVIPNNKEKTEIRRSKKESRMDMSLLKKNLFHVKINGKSELNSSDKKNSFDKSSNIETKKKHSQTHNSLDRDDLDSNISDSIHFSLTDDSSKDSDISLEQRIRKKWQTQTKILKDPIDDSTKSPIMKKLEKKISKINTKKKETTEDNSNFNALTEPNNDLKKHKINKSKNIVATKKINSCKTDREIGKVDSLKLGNNTVSFLESLSKNVPDSKCDFSAKIFKNNYKQNKEALTKKLFNLYNENIFDKALPENTNIEWNDRMSSTAGFCYCKKITHKSGLINREARIVLSNKVLDSADRLRDTLIHELCHAATWIINQVSNGHGTYWKAWANKARKIFPELPPIKTCHNYEIKTKYSYKCTGCGYSIGRHKKSLNIEKKRCGYCYGKFEILLNKFDKKGGKETVPITPKKPPTGFALFVKENYSNYKTPERKHGEVMKLLGENFKSIKL